MPNRHTRIEYTPPSADRLVAALDALQEWRTRTPRNPWAQRLAEAHEAKIRAMLTITAHDAQ